ncbi:9763_t:CDS:2 [Dentiscutata heterogama]|uniref:9763_t:CDS:1 n=1 Tax=Dentiscutata heterogama TaxID=1316150 RepID=A0ACA9LT22_9GLOM|nr:9763_t:CDS:2 [Dentiscutata heterogama]
MPKIQLRSNPIAKYIYNQDFGDLLYLANNISTNNNNSFWTKFAEMGRNGSFNNQKIFEGLCNVMFLPDFSFNDLVALTPKIACLYKAYFLGSLKSEREKTTGIGYISHYSDSSVVENLDQATALARNILGMVLNTQIHDSVAFPNNDKVEIENEIEEQSAELQRDKNLQITKSIFISIAASEVNA